eukprot:TRINITY_DN48362_c0_g1_i1.p1 TRINITY_DN48362_c0_g1~~TRINITY_DN48362_c0_g1_i1.p1  ORF type:complete len:566 (-),score=66.31 TRINITY_DN48362_c0_g1_i1:77-1774(-)
MPSVWALVQGALLTRSLICAVATTVVDQTLPFQTAEEDLVEQGWRLKVLLDEQLRFERARHQSTVDGGDTLCACEAQTAAVWMPAYVALAQDGELEEPGQRAHQLCDSHRGFLQGLMDWSGWGRMATSDCEPMVVAAGAVCGVSLAARGYAEAAVKHFSVALVTLERSQLLGCYDRSGWPFLVEELLENFVRLVEEGGQFQWISPQRPFQARSMGDFSLTSRRASEKNGDASLLEVKLRLRHALGIVDSLWNYWQRYVDPDRGLSQNFVAFHENGSDRWTWANLCRHGRAAHKDARAFQFGYRGKRSADQTTPPAGIAPPHATVRVLNACSGMFVPPREFLCHTSTAGAKDQEPMRFEVTSIDSSARAYAAILARHGWAPRPGLPQQCDIEELWRCFPSGLFDIVHVRNGLDHTPRPLQALRELARVTRPGGRILLWHLRNVHPEQWTGLAAGPHQWGFDLCPPLDPVADVAASAACASLAPAGTASAAAVLRRRDPLLWNYAFAYNLTREFEGDLEVLRARYVDNPGGSSNSSASNPKEGSPDRWVVFEFRRRSIRLRAESKLE